MARGGLALTGLSGAIVLGAVRGWVGKVGICGRVTVISVGGGCSWHLLGRQLSMRSGKGIRIRSIKRIL